MVKGYKSRRQTTQVGDTQAIGRFLDAAVLDGAKEWTCDALADSQTGGHFGETGFRLLTAGDEAFLARVSLVARAQRTLDLQYYLFGADASGALLSNCILQAADRGVRVRLLVDGWSTIWRDSQSALLNMHPNVEIRLFNPVSQFADGPLARLIAMLSNPRRINRRMHNKVFVADRKFVVVGGRNLGDRYFGVREDFAFRDIDMLCIGALVPDVCASFDAYWNSSVARTLRSVGIRNRSAIEFARFRNRLAGLRKQRRIARYEEQLSATELARELHEGRIGLIWARARLIVDPPDKISVAFPEQPSPLEQLIELAHSVTGELLLVSPYFVPGERGMAVLAALRSRGVRVVLVTNSLASTDITIVHTGYRRYRRRLLEMGVEIHETKSLPTDGEQLRSFFGPRSASLHAKAYVFDRSHVVIGSLNLDPRSMFLNTEIGVLVSNVLFAQQVSEQVKILAADDYSYQLRLEGESRSLVWEERQGAGRTRYLREPRAGLWRRFIVCLLAWLPIEEQL